MSNIKSNPNLPKSGAGSKKNDADYSRDHIKGPQANPKPAKG